MTIPTSDKTVGSSNHVEDHNAITAELSSLSGQVAQLIELGGIPGTPGADAEIGVLAEGELPPVDSEIGSLWWVPTSTTEEPPPPPPPAVTPEFVGQAASTSGSGTSHSLTIPGTIESGDLAVLQVAYNAGTPVTVSGWTLHSTTNYSPSFSVAVYTRVLTAGGSVTATWASASRVGMACVVLRNVTSIAAKTQVTAAATSIAAPTVSHTDAFVVVAGWAQRDSASVSQTLTDPASLDAVVTAFGTIGSGGAISLGIGYEMTEQTAGASYDPGTWGPGSAGGGHVAWTAAIALA